MINTNPSNAMRFRSKIVMTAAFSVLFAAVAGNFFKISVLDNKKYQNMANDQHFGSVSISAHRGSIYDSKGVAFAKSATVYKIFIDPKSFKEDLERLEKLINKRTVDIANGTYTPVLDEDGNDKNKLPASIDEFKNDAVAFLSVKLGITPEEITKAMDQDTQYIVLQEQVEKPIADEIDNYFNEWGFVSIRNEEDTKRYYPQKDLAASVIGFTNGNVAYGIESSYDKYLSGIDGRTISAVDSNGNALPYRYSKTFEPKEGNDVYLTIDREIQYILEKNLEDMVRTHYVKNRACAILMDPKTGAVYGMATYPTFDLNEPFKVSDQTIFNKIFAEKNITDPTEKDFKEYTPEARERMWKNKCITETYEPGSVYKVITSSAAIEENVIDIEHDSFYCEGFKKFEGHKANIDCWKLAPGHGMQTFQEALTNSCNPAFMDIGAKLGKDKFCYYFDAFGFREPTGIDLPAEVGGNNISADKMSPVDLAVSAFGQCETITPMEMITACCASINGGYLLKPYVVDKVVDSDGNIVLKNERTVRRQVISEDTSAKMRNALYNVVVGNGAGNVNIKGYAIGGKSGTSQRLSETSRYEEIKEQEDATLQEYGASYVCFTPADDPELILLVLADMPDKSGDGYYGSKCAVPTARNILTEVLPYLGKSPEYNEQELKNLDVKVPLLKGASIDEAIKTLDGMGVKYEKIGNGIEVVDQSPLTGKAIAKDGCVYLYTEKVNYADTLVTVPYLYGCSPSVANQIINDSGLNYTTKGASVERDGATVNSQSIQEGKQVPRGTTIELEFMVNEMSD
ncbi:penicillin-binding transpeptidase domain-containing protein [Ruminococcus flavefaciens]|uniref:Stage V sporulation protein D (Sporulation-specific penicillin-binding protein) n=1 Tax=Ruminococcus flavefaciens TaxID=1265 RepID=A0A1K1P6L0_RUMFL|nr:penicillin-binding transpeptidase domain-containing protein [Ruminococcus flavefaciens]SFW43137.1 stage V sporulation protein D (sporulation-specific penicillin-binding protein) [Ruminococcus flavefaciens]